jgi:hypothetical protein
MPDLRDIAEEINLLHKDSPGTHDLAPDYRYIGLAGQQAAARLLGVTTDLSVGGGDGGKDMFVWVDGVRYKVDAKTSRLPHLGMLVEVAKARADIYMFMSWPELECWGWNWHAKAGRRQRAWRPELRGAAAQGSR